MCVCVFHLFSGLIPSLLTFALNCDFVLAATSFRMAMLDWSHRMGDRLISRKDCIGFSFAGFASLVKFVRTYRNG